MKKEKKKKNSKLLCLALLILILSGSGSGCAHVVIQDAEWCGDAGFQGAFCFHTLTAATEDIPKVQWDADRVGQICTNDPAGHSGQTFANMKTVIEELCNEAKNCTYETQQQIEAFFERAEQIQSRLESTSAN